MLEGYFWIWLSGAATMVAVISLGALLYLFAKGKK